MLRFTNFNQRTTPEIEGEVSRIGADVSRDDKTAPTYFLVRIAIPPPELKQARDRASAAGHAGRGLHPDQRANGAVLSDEAAGRPGAPRRQGEMSGANFWHALEQIEFDPHCTD
ncbi:HlyD family secretion protein [Bradyrhizobium altum]|uniref:HlyD family secretion protein n=1 Tax=Bradyrhizobium altum TaxID=1571202 RepID=UPI00289816A3|nr:HlyD family secretion protein [Bradyrhizobium altum]